jgi:SAM-dependent methyltransferase
MEARELEALEGAAEFLAILNRTFELDDVQLYRRLVDETGRPAVELGIGEGRVARHLRPDVGIDLSRTALAYCRRDLPDPPVLLEADFRDYSLPERARLTYSPLNTLNYVPDAAERRRVFANVLRNTAEGGRLAFDCVVPRPDRLSLRNNVPVLRGRDGDLLLYDITSMTDFDTGEARIHAFVERVDASGRLLSRRYFPPVPFAFPTPEQLREEAESAGWAVEALWGGFHEEEFTETSPVQVWLLRRS